MDLNISKILSGLLVIINIVLSQNALGQKTTDIDKGYRFELNADYSFNDTKYSENMYTDSKTNYALGGLTYYFGKVDISKGPLALATFLDRSSAAHFSYGLGEYSDRNKHDLNVLNFAGNYVHKSSGWFANAYYSRTKVDANPENNISNTYAVTVGKYFAEYSTLSLGYVKNDSDYLGSNTYSLSNFHVQELKNGSFIDAGISLSYIDYDDLKNAFRLNLETTYYFTKSLGVGVVGEFTTGKDVTGFRYGLNAEWFVIDNLSINAVYNRMNTNSKNEMMLPDFDNNIVSAGLKFRF
ncbi:hypothetical protein [Aureibacter tunicatorum]|uniref:Porin n=1 Tax=Aureibacter tunicatorum TaxID=866807 RepID=A0AAE3XU90_9BACT|nr:hypothetical protein [Aureibacter tunicatorum]MDR6241804.1 hypothetical protein [Aureibacter tunicatorum]BDD07051.1 hypothetical protein AUTU_45340 [Aureibacter tunicatorum]